MKKVFATILAVALVAVLVPTTVSAAGFTTCNNHGLLIPCRTPMPPSAKGTKGSGGSVSSTSSKGGSSSSNTGTAPSGRGGALPPTGIR